MTRKVHEVIIKRKGFFVIDLGFLNLTVNHWLTDCDLGYFGPGYKTLCRYPYYGYNCQTHCECVRDLCRFDSGCLGKTVLTCYFISLTIE